MAAVLGIFYLYDASDKIWLARLTHSGLVARLAVIAAVLVVLGALFIINDLLK